MNKNVKIKTQGHSQQLDGLIHFMDYFNGHQCSECPWSVRPWELPFFIFKWSIFLSSFSQFSNILFICYCSCFYYYGCEWMSWAQAYKVVQNLNHGLDRLTAMLSMQENSSSLNAIKSTKLPLLFSKLVQGFFAVSKMKN